METNLNNLRFEISRKTDRIQIVRKKERKKDRKKEKEGKRG
jgi:hypothetical protein